MRIHALHINREDDVIVVTSDAKPGDELVYVDDGTENTIIAATAVPIYHKAALRDIKKGEEVRKYNAVIGIALSDIIKGAHVHTHNLNSKDLVEGEVK